MKQKNNSGQAAPGGGLTNHQKISLWIEIAGFIIALLVFLGVKEIGRVAILENRIADTIQFHGTAGHAFAFSCNELFVNEGNAAGEVASCCAYLLAEHDSTVLAGFCVDHYVVGSQSYPTDFLMLTEHSSPINGAFNYAQTTFNEVCWKEGYYEVRFVYSYPSHFGWLYGPKYTTVASIHHFWLSAANASLLNKLKGKSWKKIVSIPMI
jgi:hypothetical protein